MKSAEPNPWMQRLVKVTGLDESLLARPAVKHWIDQRQAALHLPDLSDYVRRLTDDRKEVEQLIHEIAVPETWFFRYPASFQVLIDFAARRRRDGHAQLKMLSVACATGQEPYGMAIAAIHAGWPIEQLEIDALDRHAGSIAFAQSGIYKTRSLRDDIPTWAAPWLENNGNAIQVDPKIVQRIHFQCADILAPDWSTGSVPYDVVFCRNLLIYLSPSARMTCIQRLFDSIAPDGLLCVGHAEHLESLQGKFQKIATPHAFAYSRLKQNDRRTSAPQRTPSKATTPAKNSTPSVPSPRRSAPIPNLHEPNAASVETTSLDAALALADAGKIQEALAMIESRIASGHREPETFAMHGRLLLAVQQFPQARDAYKRVVYLDPHHEEALLQLANLHERSGDTAQAQRFRRRAARVHQNQAESRAPDSTSAHHRKGVEHK